MNNLLKYTPNVRDGAVCLVSYSQVMQLFVSIREEDYSKVCELLKIPTNINSELVSEQINRKLIEISGERFEKTSYTTRLNRAIRTASNTEMEKLFDDMQNNEFYKVLANIYRGDPNSDKYIEDEFEFIKFACYQIDESSEKTTDEESDEDIMQQYEYEIEDEVYDTIDHIVDFDVIFTDFKRFYNIDLIDSDIPWVKYKFMYDSLFLNKESATFNRYSNRAKTNKEIESEYKQSSKSDISKQKNDRKEFHRNFREVYSIDNFYKSIEK